MAGVWHRSPKGSRVFPTHPPKRISWGHPILLRKDGRAASLRPVVIDLAFPPSPKLSRSSASVCEHAVGSLGMGNANSVRRGKAGRTILRAGIGCRAARIADEIGNDRRSTGRRATVWEKAEPYPGSDRRANRGWNMPFETAARSCCNVH